MAAEIFPARIYMDSLKEKYEGLEIPVYKMKYWLSAEDKIFFDCEEAEPISCLEKVLTKCFDLFTVFILVKTRTGSYMMMDVKFRNIGNETLNHFIHRYHRQLESMTRLSIQTSNMEYLECIGHSYE
jgi:hypothetical protein